MKKYNVSTAKGVVVCYEQNGVYYPVYDSDKTFLYEPILSVEEGECNECCDCRCKSEA